MILASDYERIINCTWPNSFKDFTNLKKKANSVVVFNCRSFPDMLKYRDHWWDLLTIWEKDSLMIQWRLIFAIVTLYSRLWLWGSQIFDFLGLKHLSPCYLGPPIHKDIIEFQNFCCTLKIRDLGAKLCVVFLLF